jgi:alkylation response protein AidB-like acyl-CoA dehydrogenase
MKLADDPEVAEFRTRFATFLDTHLPAEAEARERSRSSVHVPDWARVWQRTLFDAGWLLPGRPPEYGGRNATLPQQLAHLEELARRRIYHSFNPQGLGIIAASLLSFGTEEQKRRWAVPILRAEITAALGMSEPDAGSDLASLRTSAVERGDEFVVNGQKIWTSGAHDADVLLTFVRTDPQAPKHRGISALLIPTDTEGVVRRPAENPVPLGYPSFHSDYWDPVWRALTDCGTVMNPHIGSSDRLAITSADAPPDVMITLQPINLVQAAADLMWSRVLKEYPDIKIALSEGGTG